MFNSTCEFSVFYCLVHDEGFVVAGHHECDGEEFAHYVCGTNSARPCNCLRVGNVSSDDRDIIHDVDYTRFMGGWKSDYYIRNVFNSAGENINCPGWLRMYFGEKGG